MNEQTGRAVDENGDELMTRAQIRHAIAIPYSDVSESQLQEIADRCRLVVRVTSGVNPLSGRAWDAIDIYEGNWLLTQVGGLGYALNWLRGYELALNR